MAGGFWNGVIWGTVVSVAGAVTVSLLSEAPEPSANLPQAPAALTEPAPETAPEPAAEPAPEAPETPVVPVPEVGEAPDQPAPAPEVEAPVAEITPDAAPEPSDAPEAPEDLTAESVPATEPEPAPLPEAAPEQAEMPDTTEADALPEPAAPVTEPEHAEAPAPIVSDVAPELPPVQPETIDMDTITPEPGLSEPAGNLIDNRRAAEAEAEALLPQGDKPLDVFSTDFSNPEDRPMMSIIVLDTPNSALGPEVLRDFPYPVTIAIDALAPDARERMDAYRAAGFEILATASFPQGARPADAEIALGAIFDALPETIGFLEADDGSLQQSRALTDQVTAVLSDSGYGLVLQPKGLNTAQKVAVKEGVPAAAIFRDLDGKDQNADVIRRFLDNAAFRARQSEDGVVVLTRLRPETLSALLIWALQDRASQVSLAPASAILKQQADK
ncbi:divergent polysaccharide deacetylase family protein [Donghicola mangrovi]|uniref:Divergent polysaccharide deacetylase family protein n=1 Tax=Donghicola mangrovi TaxID=2729614 RepID=A0A850Q3U3_9RHOB|nr:divergent polysaccharide deacetylase family protein [Donghicola mangrovi]NVO23633.1 hypothetical protein [Donghicola mangrovi]